MESAEKFVSLCDALDHFIKNATSKEPKEVAYDTAEGAVTFLQTETPTIVYLLRIFVKQPLRNQGICTRLIRHAQSDQRIKKMYVCAPTTVTQHIIEKLGFVNRGSGEFVWQR